MYNVVTQVQEHLVKNHSGIGYVMLIIMNFFLLLNTVDVFINMGNQTVDEHH